MRRPDNCKIEYCGFESPREFIEIEFELLGLDNLIKKAEERISMLKQSSYLAQLAIEDNHEVLDTLFSGEENEK